MEPSPAGTEAAAGPRPARLYVVSDAQGFVGAYYSLEQLQSDVCDRFPGLGFCVQDFPAAGGELDTVWVVLYRDLDAVAFASNSREEALRAQLALGRVGLVHPDSIDYWAHPVGSIQVFARQRLEILRRANLAYGGLSGPADAASAPDAEAALAALFAREDAHNARSAEDARAAFAAREPERVSIMEAVVAFSREPLPPPDPAAAALDRTRAVELVGRVEELRAREAAAELAGIGAPGPAGEATGADETKGGEDSEGGGGAAETAGPVQPALAEMAGVAGDAGDADETKGGEGADGAGAGASEGAGAAEGDEGAGGGEAVAGLLSLLG